jgi:hypothetical protein
MAGDIERVTALEAAVLTFPDERSISTCRSGLR